MRRRADHPGDGVGDVRRLQQLLRADAGGAQPRAGRDQAGREQRDGDVPVAEGAAGALLGSVVRATEVHGESGIGSLQLPPTDATALPEGAVALMARHGDECVFSADALGLRPLWALESQQDFVFSSEPGVVSVEEMVSEPKPMASVTIAPAMGHANSVPAATSDSRGDLPARRWS